MASDISQFLGFRQLESLLRSGSHHPLVQLRSCAYGDAERDELVRDVIALANTPGSGPRYIVLGARSTAARVECVAASRAEHMLGLECARSVSACIEPVLRVDYVQWPMTGGQLGVLVIDVCDNRPYLARCDIGNIRMGDGWIRDGTVGEGMGARRLSRRDLDRLFQERFSETPFRGDIQVGFDANPLTDVIRLHASDLSGLPSRLTTEQLQTLLVAKEAGNNQDSKHTYIGRLTYARLFGGDTPYVDKSVETLRTELCDIAARFAHRDRHFKYELQAHRVNLRVRVSGDCPLENVSLTLHLPARVGLDVAPCIYREDTDPSGHSAHGGRYPNLETTSTAFRIGVTFDSLARDADMPAFEQPLRIVVEEAALGFKFPLRYEIRANNLRKTIRGKLYIVCPSRQSTVRLRRATHTKEQSRAGCGDS